MIVASADSNRQVTGAGRPRAGRPQGGRLPGSRRRRRRQGEWVWSTPATSWCTSCSPATAPTTTSKNCGQPASPKAAPRKPRHIAAGAMAERDEAHDHRDAVRRCRRGWTDAFRRICEADAAATGGGVVEIKAGAAQQRPTADELLAAEGERIRRRAEGRRAGRAGRTRRGLDHRSLRARLDALDSDGGHRRRVR